MKKCHKLNNKVLKDFLVMINNKATNVNLYLDKITSKITIFYLIHFLVCQIY